MNPDMMPIPWWKDEEYWIDYTLSEIAKMKKKDGSIKRDWLRDIYDEESRLYEKYLMKEKEELLFEFGHLYDYEDEHRKSKGANQAGRGCTSRRFKEGQLVQAAFGHPDYSDRKGDLGLIIQSDLEIHGRPTTPLSVKVMWPDGSIETISEDDLQACKSDTDGL